MAAPVGNRFWELRSKHGRDKLFETPEDLWQAACEFFAWCDENPLIETDYRGKDLVQVEIPKMRAYTLKGLTLYLDCNEAYFRQFQDKKGEGFSTVIERIENVIYTQKFTGAAAGFLNPLIISRDLGLKDKTESELTIKDYDISLNLDTHAGDSAP